MKAKAVRQLALEHRESGISTAQIALFLKVSQRTVQLWIKQGPEQDNGKPLTIGRRTLSPIQEEGVLEFVEGNPGIFLQDVIDMVSQRYAVTISRNSVSALLKRNAITRKRGTRVNLKYNSQLGEVFLNEIRPLYSTTSFASIDEMSVMLNLAPTYGYAKRGQRAVIRQPSRRTVSYMITLCVSPTGIVFWDLRDGSVTAQTFCKVLQGLPNGLILMLDNARVHHATKCLSSKGLPTVAELAASKSISLKFIPAYAPHLNPVEYTFNTVRNLLRQKEAWTLPRLKKGLRELFATESFCEEAMSKLFKSVIFGGPDPGQRLSV